MYAIEIFCMKFLKKYQWLNLMCDEGDLFKILKKSDIVPF